MKKIDTAMFGHIVRIAFAEFCTGIPMSMSACIGVRSAEGTIETYSYGHNSDIVTQDVENYLDTIATKYVKDSDCYAVGTPHRIYGVKIRDTIFACHSNAIPGVDEAIVVTYGHYHHFYMKGEVVEVVRDTLLNHLYEWVQKNKREGSLSFPLAKKVFPKNQ